MKKYIDVDLLKAEFTGNFACEYPAPLVKALIDNQPVADAEEVVHGKWERSDKKYSYYQYKCSNCGCDDYSQTDRNGKCKLMNYCPDCGAKMDIDLNVSCEKGTHKED